MEPMTIESLREIAQTSGIRHAEFCVDQEASQRGDDNVTHLRAELDRLIQAHWFAIV